MDIRAELKDIMELKNYSLSVVAKATGLSKSVISQWLSGSYCGKNDKVMDVILNFVKREKERSIEDSIPFVETSIVKYIFEIGRLCHTKGKIGVCAGKAGLGKTIAVKEYTKHYLDAILIESDSGYTAKSLLLEIHKRLGLSGKGSVYHLMDEVITKLKTSGRLLIIDEAENLPYRALEITRRIHDKTSIGVLLIGRRILIENLRGYNNQYDQLYSRVKYHKILDRLLPQDINKILESINQDLALCKTYLEFSDGNTRKLEHLISHSICVAKINDKKQVDKSVIKQTSNLLMA